MLRRAPIFLKAAAPLPHRACFASLPRVTPSAWSRCNISHRGLATAASPLDVVDLAKYPLDRLGTPAAREFLESRCAQLNAENILILRGFLTQSAVAAVLEEAKARFNTPGLPFESSEDHNVMLDEEERVGPLAKLPLQVSAKWLVAADQLPASSPLLAMYESEELVTFVSGLLGAQVYHSADPMNRVHLNRFDAGHGLGWHHDNSEFFFNIQLQTPQSGGELEYVVNSRPHVQTIVDTVSGTAETSRPVVEAGDAIVFRGRQSIHRVTQVVGDIPRITAILNFASAPGGGIIEEYTRMKFFGRNLPKGASLSGA
eukprot:gnl/TRDRNA2_/TRDRNA2_193230_c0_seq1.p1 gnl/TRDRNA2_/TRDRNA2_193230_c0~~gnl/TRDRNA2_/TRDRNA2_193230_c0_seq1.p1  ORF type:complete len:315 (-),score=49.06 gnl/TRDRNA2_/TRDRNA2_193230_c0_seq1:198-1142(-)